MRIVLLVVVAALWLALAVGQVITQAQAQVSAALGL